MDKDNKKICVFDIEGDSLSPTKIWVMSAAIFSKGGWRLKSTTDYDEMRAFFLGCDTLIGHNIMLWDIPHIERILDIKIKAKVIDTLALSWYLEPYRNRHGLAEYGEDFGIPKPKIDNWEDLSVEEYTHRCEEDVKINCKLIDKQWRNLNNLYDGNKDDINRLVKYLMFKMECARAAEVSGWKLDVERCESVIQRLEAEKAEKELQLKAVMPWVDKVSKMKKPVVFYKKNGDLSAAAMKWLELLEAKGLPETHEETVEYVTGSKEPNPNATQQIKKWLFSLGWKPETFTFSRQTDGSTKKTEQVRKEIKGEKVLCESVKRLYTKEPQLVVLEGLSVLTHRIPVLKTFLKNVDDSGYIKAEIQGITNTLRFKHKVVVNLPSVGKPYGEEVRGCLIAPEGYELCGSDMSSLEDRTKQHYMWNYDPEYVKEMQTPDFDPHLDLAVVAGFLTEEQAQAHKEGTEKFGAERAKAKTANYACVYGAGGATVARGAGMTKQEGINLVEKYWERNWSVKKIAEAQKTKRCLDSMWLFNPVSKLWYSLRTDKDRFSTLNQGTGVFCFDMWIYNFMSNRAQITGQMHDEVILTVKKGHRDEVTKLLKDAIQLTNKQLKLNRDLDIDVQFGNSYAEIH
jgi:hypothetical protein